MFNVKKLKIDDLDIDKYINDDLISKEIKLMNYKEKDLKFNKKLNNFPILINGVWFNFYKGMNKDINEKLIYSTYIRTEKDKYKWVLKEKNNKYKSLLKKDIWDNKYNNYLPDESINRKKLEIIKKVPELGIDKEIDISEQLEFGSYNSGMGLSNDGNTSYQNSVIQILYNIIDFREILISIYKRINVYLKSMNITKINNDFISKIEDIDKLNKNPILKRIRRIINMDESKLKEFYSTNIAYIYYLGKYMKKIKEKNTRNFYVSYSKFLNIENDISDIENNDLIFNQNKEKDAKEFLLYTLKLLTNFNKNMKNIFNYNLLLGLINIKNDTNFYSNNIKLSIPDDYYENNILLKKMIEFDNGICEFKQNKNYNKYIKLRKYVIIILDKLNYKNEKIKYKIFFDENKITLYENRKYGYKYKVIGIICHLANSYNEGHYYSIIRRNNIWYKVNDWRFDEYEYNSDEIAENAYILILENSKYKNTNNYIDSFY